MEIVKVEKLPAGTVGESNLLVRMTQSEYSLLSFLAIRNNIELSNQARAAAAAAAADAKREK